MMEIKVDNLGRVVIPIRIRKKLGIECGSNLLISSDEDTIHITVKDSHCALCGNSEEICKELKICKSCMDRIKNS